MPLSKEEQIKQIQSLVNGYNVIGLFSLNGITSSVIQQIRRSLRGQTELKIAKNTLKLRAIEECLSTKPDVEVLKDHITDSCGLIFSNMNPFKLQRFLHQNRKPAPARIGQIAPLDVIVPEGNTNLDPGPVIGELNSVGLTTRIEKGKIKILKTAKILTAGETVTEAHASVLSRLGILPFESGLEMTVAYEDGVIFKGEDLNIDVEGLINDLKRIHNQAISMAMHISYICPETIIPLLKMAHQHAMSLSIESEYLSEDTIKPLILKGNSHAIALISQLRKIDANAIPKE